MQVTDERLQTSNHCPGQIAVLRALSAPDRTHTLQIQAESKLDCAAAANPLLAQGWLRWIVLSWPVVPTATSSDARTRLKALALAPTVAPDSQDHLCSAGARACVLCVQPAFYRRWRCKDTKISGGESNCTYRSRRAVCDAEVERCLLLRACLSLYSHGIKYHG